MTDVTAPSEAPASGRKQHLGWALVLISVAQLMVVLDGTIVNIALPFIQTDLGISQDNLRWVVTGYALAFGSLLLLGGRLGDLYGRRKIFIAGELGVAPLTASACRPTIFQSMEVKENYCGDRGI